MDRSQIEATLREILGKRLPKANPAAITLDEELVNLGIDSLAFSWISADIEDAFEFIMNGADIMHLKTLQMAVAYVEKRLSI